MDWYGRLLDQRRGLDDAFRKAAEKAIDEACSEMRTRGIYAERVGRVR